MRHRPGALAALLSSLWLATSPAMAAPITAADTHIARMGRTDAAADGSVRFAYPGVSFFLNFEGTRLSMEAEADGDRSYVDVIVDQRAARKLRLAKGRQTLTLVEGAGAGKHTVEIVNRSETWHGVLALRGFDTDGKWGAAPQLPQRKLLVMGDSITCGEAIDRVPGAKKDPSWWNPRASYGMLLARTLQSQVQLVCYGGRGLIRTWDNKTDQLNLPDYYRMTIADQQHPVLWDQNAYKPDAILIAIGTNDFAPGTPDREQYVQAYVKLLQTVLKDHPQAQIMLTTGGILRGAQRAMLADYIAETVRRIGDKRVHAIASTGYPGDATDGHPTREQQASMAADLLPQVRAVMHW